MTFKLSRRSLERMQGVHPDLVKVVLRAIKITEVDFGVTEGLRTIEKQREYVSRGASKTMNCRHLTGHAVDLVAYVGGAVSWEWPHYHKIAAAMKAAAKESEIAIVCGADWKNFPDGPHFELDRRVYP